MDALEGFFNFNRTDFVVSKKEYGSYIDSRFTSIDKKIVKKSSIATYYFPVEPNPPRLRSVSSRLSTGRKFMFSTF